MCVGPEWFSEEAQRERHRKYEAMSIEEAAQLLPPIRVRSTAPSVADELEGYIRANWSEERKAQLAKRIEGLYGSIPKLGDSTRSEASNCDREDWQSRDLKDLAARLQIFAKERDWEQFHSPKNIVMALVKEAAELMEPFQWLSPNESYALSDKTRQEVANEIGDTLIYLVRLADRIGIDPLAAAIEKIDQNDRKYPVEKARGSAKKYTDL